MPDPTPGHTHGHAHDHGGGWSRFRPALIALVTALLAVTLLPSLASAHQPEANLGSPDWRRPYDVPAPDVSRSIRGVVAPGQQDFYSFRMDRTEPITLWLLTPMVPPCDGFDPVMRLWAPAVAAQLVREWDGTSWYGATVRASLDPDGWITLWAERWGVFQHGSRSNSGPAFKPVLPAGDYLVGVHARPGRGGAYTFAIGDLEIPGGGVDRAVQARWERCPEGW